MTDREQEVEAEVARMTGALEVTWKNELWDPAGSYGSVCARYADRYGMGSSSWFTFEEAAVIAARLGVPVTAQ